MYSDILLRKQILFNKLEFDIDLHIAIYVYNILQNIFDFSLDKYNNIIIIKNSDKGNKKYDFQLFKYWIQYTFYNELVLELPQYNNAINIEINEIRQRINEISVIKCRVIKTEKEELPKLFNKDRKLKEKLKEKVNSIKRTQNVISNCISFILRHLNTDETMVELFKNMKTVIHNK